MADAEKLLSAVAAQLAQQHEAVLGALAKEHAAAAQHRLDMSTKLDQLLKLSPKLDAQDVPFASAIASGVNGGGAEPEGRVTQR